MTARAIAGVQVPDSRLAREAAAFVRDTERDVLFRHSVRVYFWAALLGERMGLTFDRELRYTAALFHDFGLTDGYRESQRRFEVDGADAAREFLRRFDVPERDAARVWAAVALHTTPGIPEHMEPEVSLVQAGAGLDVVGRGYEHVAEAHREAVVAAYPRGADFERELVDTFYHGLKHRPDSTYGTFNDDILACKDPTFQRKDYCRMILGSRWARGDPSDRRPPA